MRDRPDKLFHGTFVKNVPSINRIGLRNDVPTIWYDDTYGYLFFEETLGAAARWPKCVIENLFDIEGITVDEFVESNPEYATVVFEIDTLQLDASSLDEDPRIGHSNSSWRYSKPIPLAHLKKC